MGNPDVDAFIQTRVPAPFQEIVTGLRTLMADSAPEAAEVLTYGSPAWRGNKILAVISVSKTHITFAFERGAEFADAHGLLTGSGKKTRHVKLKKPEDLRTHEEALRDYVSQAVRLDKE
ncbi:DUF1801 domain-containing protein [Nonomuraea candida]|uniref:DUF1801 domain-containing protein n=1 Tax=Nonomuraea candida TaxID=359159 RepID=UPI0006938061|nr:DUF1801 domain-containing protein [Nonomuraea candida]